MLEGRADPQVLAWAAEGGGILLTHDTRTMSIHAYARVAAGEPMPGVIEIPDLLPIGQAIEEVLLLAELTEPSELRDRVLRLPL